MGGVPKQRHSKSKAHRRRSHLALKPAKLVACPNCKAPKFPHRACKHCGYYGSKKSS